MPLNLHAIANKAICMALPNLDMAAIRCTGFRNDYGLMHDSYGACERLSVQAQSLNGDELSLVNNLMQGEISRKFFLATKGAPLTAGRRHDGQGSSYLFDIKAKTFWKVFNVNEDFALSGWQMVYACVDPTPPQSVKQALKDSGIGGPLEFDTDVGLGVQEGDEYDIKR